MQLATVENETAIFGIEVNLIVARVIRHVTELPILLRARPENERKFDRFFRRRFSCSRAQGCVGGNARIIPRGRTQVNSLFAIALTGEANGSFLTLPRIERN